MYTDFNSISAHSKIWIYQTNRILSAKEENIVAYELKKAIEGWEAHGVPLLGAFQIEFGRFVILAVDENQNQASGCSIDSSTRWFKEIGQKLSIDFFNRSIFYQSTDGIQDVDLKGIKQKIELGEIKSDTLVFNSNFVQNKKQLLNEWKVEAAKIPFLKKYFEKIIA